MIKHYKKCTVVAEIGATHIGNMDRAKSLILLAALSGVDYVKFQKRNPHESVPDHMKNQPHPNSRFSYGSTYLEHRLALELSVGQHAELKEYCESKGVKYSSSVWDLTSAKEIISLGPDYIKIPSACNMKWEIISLLALEFSGNIHISTGMLSIAERSELYTHIIELGIQKRVVIYHCTSEYPCPFEHLYLREIEKLMWAPACEVGFSNHGFGIASDIVAYMLGATWIERHFIDDRTFPHTDAIASLEPSGLAKLVRDMKAIRKTLAYKEGLSPEELKQKEKLRVI